MCRTKQSVDLWNIGIFTGPAKWEEFAAQVSGEWDGYNVEFNMFGEPLELPENVVPDAFREWNARFTIGRPGARPSLIPRKAICGTRSLGCTQQWAVRLTLQLSTASRNAMPPKCFRTCVPQLRFVHKCMAWEPRHKGNARLRPRQGGDERGR